MSDLQICRHSGRFSTPFFACSWGVVAEKPNTTQVAWIQGAILLAAVLFLSYAISGIRTSPEFWDGNQSLNLILLVTAGAFTRRYGIPLPGKGFTSFLFATVWIGLFLHDRHFAVVVAALGTVGGDAPPRE